MTSPIDQLLSDIHIPNRGIVCQLLATDVAARHADHLGIVECGLKPAQAKLRDLLVSDAGNGELAAASLRHNGGEVFRKLLKSCADNRKLQVALCRWGAIVAPEASVEARNWTWSYFLPYRPDDWEATAPEDAEKKEVREGVIEFRERESAARDALDGAVWEPLSQWDSDFYAGLKSEDDDLDGRDILSSCLCAAALNWHICTLSRRLADLTPPTVHWLQELAMQKARLMGVEYPDPEEHIPWPPVPRDIHVLQQRLLTE